jgi:hypothetical protein
VQAEAKDVAIAKRSPWDMGWSEEAEGLQIAKRGPMRCFE